ncbi:MAG TPA: sarcosine oxidase subunit alpha family protein [Xanthobacteraceae bacterium]|nr:sarcosine oxidase subunit alpha family protein [Xanthobacteraceae bacterium]
MSRLPRGGLIERTRPLAFSFDGRAYAGFQGDTLASALLANDVTLVGRSFKYHRPRGIVGAGTEEPNALVELRHGARREPNARATTVELFDGLEARSQNAWPSLGFDLMAVNGWFSPFFGAGFYYKTFMWPKAAWEKLYEPVIRRAAGLGRAAEAPDPDSYDKAHAFCDVLVIGSGPAGLCAALAAGRAGARVILAEEDTAFGGRLLSETGPIDDAAPAAYVAAVLAELASLPNVRLMARTAVFGVYDGGLYGALERVADHKRAPDAFEPRQRLWKILARRAVLAAGSLDRPIVFGGNDRPGVMLAQAVQTYLNRFAVAPARSMAFFANNDAAWTVAFEAADAGAGVAAIIDVRHAVPEDLIAEATRRGLRRILGGEVVATSGKTLRAIDVAAAGRTERIAVDGLAMSGGYSPSLQLTCHHGGRPVWDAALAAFVPGRCPPGLSVAGAAGGVFARSACFADGAAKGAAAAQELGFTAPAFDLPSTADGPTGGSAFWHVATSRGLAFIDFQNDVASKDVALAVKEGFTSVEHLKRYTTLGMATDQGKLANVPGLAMLAQATGRSMADVGTTLFRPPWSPVSFAAFAGHHRGRDLRPSRPTPTHAWAQEHGAVFNDSGAWLRAAWFPQAGEAGWREAVAREVHATRTAAGFIDVSTLGKIDLQGPDVGRLLDRLYANGFSGLPVGKLRYGLMCREDGLVMDDGTTARLSEDRWLMSTTTANAAKVFQHIGFCLDVLWPELDVQAVSVTEHWAQIAVSGPRARDVLARLVDDPDAVAAQALPYLGVVEAPVMGGTKARIFRLSFAGELGYEIAVPADRGDALARALIAAGAPFGITPYGVEALAVMRIEKGHVSGPELNGQTTAADLGFGRMMSARKDFIGRVMAQREGLIDPARPALVGLRPVDRAQRLAAGAHLLERGAAATTSNDLGWVSSACWSPTLGHAIGLGFLVGGTARHGEVVRAWDGLRASDVEVEICAPCFYDPEGARLRG